MDVLDTRDVTERAEEKNSGCLRQTIIMFWSGYAQRQRATYSKTESMTRIMFLLCPLSTKQMLISTIPPDRGQSPDNLQLHVADLKSIRIKHSSSRSISTFK